MSILIKGMEMPQKCGQCKLFHAEYPMYCMAVKGYRTVGAPYGMSRPDWCPLVEIPTPHGRLIDVDDFMRHLIINTADLRTLSTGTVGKALHDTPTVIEAEGSET